jgi:hypothetical protein
MKSAALDDPDKKRQSKIANEGRHHEPATQRESVDVPGQEHFVIFGYGEH